MAAERFSHTPAFIGLREAAARIGVTPEWAEAQSKRLGAPRSIAPKGMRRRWIARELLGWLERARDAERPRTGAPKGASSRLPWASHEDETIRLERGRGLTMREIAAKLPGRSLMSVKLREHKLRHRTVKVGQP